MVVFGKMSNTTNNLEKRNELLRLMTEKNKIEMEIKQYFDILAVVSTMRNLLFD